MGLLPDLLGELKVVVELTGSLHSSLSNYLVLRLSERQSSGSRYSSSLDSSRTSCSPLCESG